MAATNKHVSSCFRGRTRDSRYEMEHGIALRRDGVTASVEDAPALSEKELPSVLLEMSPSAVIFGFYHQRWMSAFVPAADGAEVTEGLITSFPTIQEVRDEL